MSSAQNQIGTAFHQYKSFFSQWISLWTLLQNSTHDLKKNSNGFSTQMEKRDWMVIPTKYGMVAVYEGGATGIVA